MGKGKTKKSAAPGKKHRGRPDQTPSAAPNPFEQLYARKKFDILGKRQKGGAKSKLQARSQANQKVSTSDQSDAAFLGTAHHPGCHLMHATLHTAHPADALHGFSCVRTT